jgi:RNA 2',3'-cyclic 3'-phosphodiesterase
MPGNYLASNSTGTKSMDKIRAFIAIELPDNIKKELIKVISILRADSSVPVKWVEPENVHITLKFLGDIDTERVDAIINAVKQATAGIPPFKLEVRGLGVFPNPKKTQVAWAGLSGDMEVLVHLQQNVEFEMEEMGFSREMRKFSPHLTLARVRDNITSMERERFGNLVTGASFSAGTIKVESVNLMKSLLTRQGAVYSRLGSIGLQ